MADRKNSVLVNDKDAQDCESNWFSGKSTQKHVQLHANRDYIDLDQSINQFNSSNYIIHSYSFIENRNDRTHLHKYTQYKKDIKTVKTVNDSP